MGNIRKAKKRLLEYAREILLDKNNDLHLQNVSNRRELLIVFVQWYNPKLNKNEATDVVEYFENLTNIIV